VLLAQSHGVTSQNSQQYQVRIQNLVVLNNFRSTKIIFGPKKPKNSTKAEIFFPVKKTNIPYYMINAGGHFVEDEMNTSVTVCSRRQQGLPHAGKLQLRIRLTELIFGQANGFCIMSILLSGFYCLYSKPSLPTALLQATYS